MDKRKVAVVSVTLAGSAFVALWLVLPQGVEQQPATLDTIVRFEGPGPRDAELEAVIRQYGPGHEPWHLGAKPPCRPRR
jgi:hypothetical protein